MTSLRDLYVDPSNAWSFVPSAPGSKQYSRPVSEFTPALEFYKEPYGLNTAHLFRSVAASAVMQYTTSALVNPWEVGKLLLQVQWVPRDAGDPLAEQEYVEDEVEETVRLACCPQSLCSFTAHLV